MLSPSLYINGMALGRTGRSLLPEEEDERMESEVPHHMPVWMCDSFDLSAKDSCSLLSVEDSDIQTVTSSVCSFEEVACSLTCLPVKSSCCLLFFRIFCIFISVLSDFFFKLRTSQFGLLALLITTMSFLIRFISRLNHCYSE